ncbi:MAG: prepilin-type N-terminal cleavage/methylation domain-containing protein [Pirellulales bacterium]
MRNIAPEGLCALRLVHEPGCTAIRLYRIPHSAFRIPAASPGVTLIELLIVVFILSLLMAAAIPVVRPAMETSTLREATRSVATMLGTAKARAQETGRPHGVLFEPMANRPAGCYTLFYAYQPPPYAGDSINSRIVIAEGGGANERTISFPSGDAWNVIVRPGDELKLNFRGHRWRLTNINGNTVTFASDTTSAPPPITPAGGVPFQFYRRPVKASGSPVQLPGVMVVDLSYSGLGDGRFPLGTGNTQPITLMFGPNGLPSRVYHEGALTGQSVTQNVYFLIGTPDKLGDDNLASLENMWVGVVGQTGLIVTAENAAGADLAERRQYVSSGQSMVGG